MAHKLITTEHAEARRNTADGSADRLLHGALTGRILSSFFEVYWELGYGFVESVYARAMDVEFAFRGIAASRERPLSVRYRGVDVGDFRADFVVEETILLELKVVDRLAAAHEGQLLNYLHATGLEVGLVLNFGPRPTFRRVVLTRRNNRNSTR